MTLAFRSFVARCSLLSALAAGLSWSPTTVQACTRAHELIEHSQPAHGDVDVPTDAVLFAYGDALSTANEVQLLDPTTGTSLPFETLAAPNGLDLLPLEPLLPNRKYQLVVSPPSDDAFFSEAAIVEFTTGSGPAAPAPAPRAPKVEATVITSAQGSCGVVTQLCLEMAEQPGATIEVRVGDELFERSGDGWGFPGLLGFEIAATDCIDVQLRDALGRRSPSTALCGSELRRVALEDTDSTEYATCANYSRLLEQTEEGARGAPPDQVSSPLPDPQVANSTEVSYASDGSAPSPSVGRGSSGCAMSPTTDGLGFAGLGVALSALLAVRRRRGR